MKNMYEEILLIQIILYIFFKFLIHFFFGDHISLCRKITEDVIFVKSYIYLNLTLPGIFLIIVRKYSKFPVVGTVYDQR